tara:strand:+ start:234 stop:464 length:231 start_codon:yes stop_codon:yes gene_type:complete
MLKLTDKIILAKIGIELKFRKGYGKRFSLVLVCDNNKNYCAGDFYPDTGFIQLYGFPATTDQLIDISIAVKSIANK